MSNKKKIPLVRREEAWRALGEHLNFLTSKNDNIVVIKFGEAA